MDTKLVSRRAAAVLLCVLLVMASLPLSVFAESKDDGETSGFRYTAIGDASTFGFGMDKDAGFGVLTEGTYPAVLKESLEAEGLTVNVDQMAMKGMRAEELRFLLDDSYAGDAYLKETFPDLADQRAAFRDSLKNADLITYSLGAVNFGSFMLYAAKDTEIRCDDPQVQALAEADEEGVKKSLSDVLNSIEGIGSDQVKEFLEPYIDAVVYVYYSYCLNYGESIRLIRELNPDADIIVLGLGNMLEGVSVKVLKTRLAIGDLYNSNIIRKVNSRLKSTDGIYAYADTASTDRFLDDIKAYDGKPENLSPQFRDYCDIYEDDLLIRDSVENALKGYSKAAKERALTTAYDAVASSLYSVSRINGEELSSTDLLYVKNNFEVISNAGKELMAGLKAKSLELAGGTADDKDYQYSKKLGQFIDGASAGSGEGKLYYGYGDDPDKADKTKSKIGRLIMSIGIRSQMGEGFFQQPSPDGHRQIADGLMEKCQGMHIHCAASEPTCERPGSRMDYWLIVGTGKYYSNEACTAEIKAEDLFISPLGHDYGKAVVVVPAEFCKDGISESTCSRCGNVKTETIPGKGPANTKLKKLTAAKKAFKATWQLPSGANLKKTTGYEIRYSLKSSMAGSKSVTINKNKTTSYTVKKLKAKKKYYVQIRTFKKSDGKKYYSAWSAKKSVKTR